MPSPILLPLDFVLTRTPLTWRELLVALDRGWVQPRDALTVAHRHGSDGAHSAALNDLQQLTPADRVMPYVMALASEEPEQEPAAMITLWGDLALAWTWHYREALADPLATVADLWSDFDFPPAWEPFIHYLITPDAGGDGQQARERAFARWERYVMARFPQ